jgi:hypothetical protein
LYGVGAISDAVLRRNWGRRRPSRGQTRRSPYLPQLADFYEWPQQAILSTQFCNRIRNWLNYSEKF